MSLRCEPSSPPLRRIRTISVVVAALVALTLLVATPATPAGADATTDWLTAINSYRGVNGLAPLQLDGQLSALAQQHSQEMAGSGLHHTGDLTAGITAPWARLAENVGQGTTFDAVWDAFKNSPGHRANLLNPELTHVGIGVVTVGVPGTTGSQIWVTHRFMAIGAPAAPAPVYVLPSPDPAPPVAAPAPRRTAPTTVAPPPVTTTVPEPEPVIVPAASAPDRAAAVLDALHRIDR